MSSNNSPVVSVCMITFNHEDYIREAIEGILMQKLSFRTELVIGEDFSTDKTRQICQEYASKHSEINLLPSETNLGMIPNFMRTMKACTGKYIAFCEGDDYWTDPHKLQKQVDFLDQNPDQGMVHTGFKWFFSDTNKEQLSSRDVPSGDIYEDYLIRSFIGTLTTVARSELIDDYQNNFKFSINGKIMGDRPLWLYIASRSKIGYINETTAVYRRHKLSATSFSSTTDELKFFIESYKVRFYFMENVRKPSEKTRRKVYENYYRGLLEYNSQLFDRRASSEAYLYLSQNKHATFKDGLILLRAREGTYNKLSSFLMFLAYGKKECIKRLIIRSN